MFDDERPTERLIIDPGQPPKYESIPPARPSIPLMSASKAADSRPLRLYDDSNHSMLPSYEKSKGRPWDIDLTSIDGKHFSLDETLNFNAASPDLKKLLMSFLASMPPDSFETILSLAIRFLAFLSTGQTPQRPLIPAESPFKEALEWILKAQGLRHPSESADNGEGFQKNVKTVWDEIVRIGRDSFLKVELTKSLQKKLKAKEIEAVLQFLILEGGVIQEIAQSKIGSNGRAPSPRYRLIRQNPKYVTDLAVIRECE